jgi:beta-hydroxylase
MSAISIAFVCFILFPAMSLFYVYKLRGEVRFTGPVEYFRKGWPIFAPLNVLLYGFSKKKAKKPILDIAEYPELAVLRDNWEVLRDEALALHQSGSFDATTDKNSQSYYDVGFRTFYKYGWSKFYLKWYGTVHNSAERLCPQTVALLADLKTVNGAMFTVLPPGSKLTRHLDPIACSLRYHLGLSTPNDDRCYISIDGNVHSWRDGEPLLFDETYLHHAHNDTDTTRLILMCDVERPMFWFGRGFNFLYKKICSLMLVPNLPEDKAGLFSRIFFKVSPILQQGKALKKSNRPLYLLIKWTLNLIILALLVVVLSAITTLVINFFKALM